MHASSHDLRKFEAVRSLSTNTVAGYTIVLLLLLCLSSEKVFSQFSGTLLLSGNSSNNVTGTDTTAPDKAFTPSIDLAYRLSISKLSSINFGITYNPNWYIVSTDRSFTKFDLSTTGSFYLSEDKPTPPPAPIVSSVAKTTVQSNDEIKPIPKSWPTKPTTENTVANIALSLSRLSERLDDVDIDTIGIDDEDSIDLASDLKDSLSESILSVSEILSSEEYSESIQSVIVEELSADELLLKQTPLPRKLKDSVATVLLKAKTGLQTAAAHNDLLPLPTSPLEATELPERIIEKIATHGLDLANTANEDAPIITLVNGSTDITDFSSYDASISDDVATKTSLTLATLLNIPLSFESQSNSKTYEAFSYSQFEATPRISFYPSANTSFGLLYGHTHNNYPNDTLYTYAENRVRIDGRIAIGSFWIIGAQFGYAFRDYLHPLVDTIKGARGNILKIAASTENFTQSQLGATSTFLIGSKLSVGVGAAVTFSPLLRSYLLDALLGKSAIGGKASDDEFSYHLSKYFVYLVSRPIWDIDMLLDFAIEHHEYGKGINTKRAVNVTARTDKGTSFTLDLSRSIYFSDRLISLFEFITPGINLQYYSVKSTIKQYTYNNLTTTLSVSLGF